MGVLEEPVSDLRHVSRKPRKLFGPVNKSHSKISSLTITELFYSHILNIKRGSLLQEVSGVYTSPLLQSDELKNGFTRPKSFRGFRETGPRCINKHAPMKSKRIWNKELPCITYEIISKKRKRDLLKKKAKRTKDQSC